MDLTVQKMIMAELEIRSIFSVCLMMVVVSVFFFCSPFFARVDADTKAFSRKNHSKNGIPPGIRRRAGPFSGHDQYRHPYRCSSAAIRCCFRPSPLRPPDLAKLVRAANISQEPGRFVLVEVGLGCIGYLASTWGCFQPLQG